MGNAPEYFFQHFDWSYRIFFEHNVGKNAAALDKRKPRKAMLPGITAVLVSWMIVSIGFSFYVENFSHYSLIYGTLGTVIVLLMWLYMTAVILILGAELNAALQLVKENTGLSK